MWGQDPAIKGERGQEGGPRAPEDVLLPPACSIHRTGQGTAEGKDPYSHNANRVLGLHHRSEAAGEMTPNP